MKESEEQTGNEVNLADFICSRIRKNNLSSIWIDLEVGDRVPKIQVSDGRAYKAEIILSCNSAQILKYRKSSQVRIISSIRGYKIRKAKKKNDFFDFFLNLVMKILTGRLS